MNDQEPSEETKSQWKNDTNNWIWGMFYYNPKDERPYFPKRIKELGWHANYVNPTITIALKTISLQSKQQFNNNNRGNQI